MLVALLSREVRGTLGWQLHLLARSWQPLVCNYDQLLYNITLEPKAYKPSSVFFDMEPINV